MFSKINNYIKTHKLFVGGLVLLFIMNLIILKISFGEKTTTTIWDGKIANNFSKGTGTNENPYIIKNGNELAYFFKQINDNDSQKYFNKFYVLDNNIDMNNYDIDFTNFNKKFSGTLNGNGFSIFNFNITGYEDENNNEYYGIFDSLYNANISNINIKDVDIVLNTYEKVNENKKVYVSLFGKNIEKTTFFNVNVNNINIETSKCVDCKIESSMFIINDLGENYFSNINISGTSDNNDTTGLIYNYKDAEIKTVLNNIKNLYLVKDFNIKPENDFRYSIDNNKLKFEKNYPIKSVLEILNNESSLEWTYSNNSFRIKNNQNDSVQPGVKKAIKSISSVSSHESGIDNNTLYINDFESDYNYFMGLNYTYSSDGKIPTTVNKEKYSDSNLVYVTSNYFSTSIDGSNTATVSLNETVNKYTYYKIYEINNNGTSSKTDDYVEFELIDNPFSNRPNNKGFNGWITDNIDAQISLDVDLYVRKVKIPINYTSEKPNPITINFYASWIQANTSFVGAESNWSNAFSTLESQGMHMAYGEKRYL